MFTRVEHRDSLADLPVRRRVACPFGSRGRLSVAHYPLATQNVNKKSSKHFSNFVHTKTNIHDPLFIKKYSQLATWTVQDQANYFAQEMLEDIRCNSLTEDHTVRVVFAA